eukprot:jgi/Undpi1/13526/HiC_scaffold_8.g03185.m1
MVNIKNPAIKRIHADVRELMKDPSDQYHAAPLEDNLFEWHFTLRGPPATEFEGGVYHGRILLPPEYPFRPPDIVFNTPNGRFNTGTKICLTISSYHPEHWQPAWGIRLILEALISFFPSPSQGALGGLDWTPEERRKLVTTSKEWKCYKCGIAKDLLPPLRPEGSAEGGGGGKAGSGANHYADQIKELHKLKVKTADEIAAESPALPSAAAADASGEEAAAAAAVAGERSASTTNGTSGGIGVVSDAAAVAKPPEAAEFGGSSVVSAAAVAGGCSSRTSPGPENASDAAVAAAAAAVIAGSAVREVRAGEEEEGAVKTERGDDVLSFVAIAIALAMLGILIRKGLRYLDPL